MLVFQGCEQGLHARRETLPLMVIQVSQSDLVGVFRGCYLLQIEVNGVVIRQIYQQLRQPGVLQDGWQVFVSSHQLSHELGPELRPCDLIQI